MMNEENNFFFFFGLIKSLFWLERVVLCVLSLYSEDEAQEPSSLSSGSVFLLGCIKLRRAKARKTDLHKWVSDDTQRS